MTVLRRGSLPLMVADLGPENPLPPLLGHTDAHAHIPAGARIPAGVRAGLDYGRVRGIHPYPVRDGYDRRLVHRDVAVAVLDNDILQATFLLDYGGRLWSLVHLPSGRELLHSPPTMRLGNLALRDAWFAGGVEWNIGTTGHSPTTCEPLFAARLRHPDGEPVLRLYEYERLRGVVFQVDAWLPERSPVLYVYVCVRNPAGHEVPMYWWSNAAVPQTDGTRVLAPADQAYTVDHRRSLELVDFPGRPDASYPARAGGAADHFFRLADGQRPWIAALDGHGRGLFQVSTGRLRGRKLFRWGNGRGGAHWQEWLGDAERPYLEIQSGLAATQLEHLRMPAHTRWSWVEAYGLLSVDPRRVHGDFAGAREAVGRAVDALVPPARMHAAYRKATRSRDAPPRGMLRYGSGWGALEEARRTAAGEPRLAGTGTPFPVRAPHEPQRPWLDLLRDGALPDGEAPGSPVLGAGWQRLLAQAPGSWRRDLHLGYLAWAAGDDTAAEEHARRSLEHRRTAWALRLAAATATGRGRHDEAAEHYLAAVELAPDLLELVLEAGWALLAAGRAGDALDLVGSLPDRRRDLGRVRLLEATAAVRAGDLARARHILDAGLTVPNLREGEHSLHELWQAVCPGQPVPYAYDFRMDMDPQPEGDG